ncbi:nickel-responsive transcriptional regulator NikR [Candidatus Poribacteria bacterium]|nr:nickel-responsive transcriptional regulator NikR [Candidatus Poribacteria bacterium]HDO76156.1 nickel-responsive transcriptional regulator NikR [Candidatus Poribacteria bacterium]HEX29761.1 nickel-responsive transcriptional regulator NikR [Candidatus Poribacteria bacterium]
MAIVRFGVSMDERLLRQFDDLIERKGYGNRSEAIRDLIRDYIVEQEWAGDEDMVGTVTLVYDHNVREINARLTHIQHEHYRHIISTLHVHLDRDNCLEVLVIRGKASFIQKLAEKLISTRGVKHGKLTMTTTGRELA